MDAFLSLWHLIHEVLSLPGDLTGSSWAGLSEVCWSFIGIVVRFGVLGFVGADVMCLSIHVGGSSLACLRKSGWAHI